MLAVQPRADLSAPLDTLRAMVKPPALWTFRGESGAGDVMEFAKRVVDAK